MVTAKKIPAYLSLLCLTAFASCRYQQLREPAPHVHKVRTGEKFMINLPEDHSKAELWRLASWDEKVVRSLGEVWHGNEKGIDYNFEARSAGSATLQFVKRTFADSTDSTTYLLRIVDN